MSAYTGIPLTPITGTLDLRSATGEVAAGNYRVILNLAMNERRKRRRRGGWTKLFSDAEYGFNNQDLHDQLLYNLLYYESFDRVVSGGGQLISQSYQFQFPGSSTTSFFRNVIGQFCGYAPDFYYEPYPPYEIDGYFIYESFIGYPYSPCVVDSGGSIGTSVIPNNKGVSNIVFGSELHLDLDDAFPIKAGAPETFYFPAANPFIIGPFPSDVEVYAVSALSADDELWVNGQPITSGVGTSGLPASRPPGYSVGIIPAGGTMSFNVKDKPGGNIGMTIGSNVRIGIRRVGSGCNSGFPNYCVSSYYSLAEAGTEAFVNEAYNYGSIINTYSPTYRFDDTYCGSEQFTWPGCREHITGVFSFNTGTTRTLIASTKSRIYALNERRGNWQIVADALGGQYDAADCETCPSRRFRFDSLGEYLVATNNYDPVLYWNAGEQPSGCNLHAAYSISDLIDLGITRAKFVKQWKGFIFLANIEEDSFPYPNRLIWSDFNNPTSFIPDEDSAAGDHELPLNEEILAMETLGEFLYIHTTQAIWQVVFVGQENEVFRFREIYRGPNTAKFPNSIVNTGTEHIWGGDDSLYVMTAFSAGPQRIEWVHQAAGVIYNGITADELKDCDALSAFGPINRATCESFVGGFNEIEKEVWFSWPTDDNECPNMSLVLNLLYGTADIVDHGFTAFESHIPDTRPSLGDWLIEVGACRDCDNFVQTVKFGCKDRTVCYPPDPYTPCSDPIPPDAPVVNERTSLTTTVTMPAYSSDATLALQWSADGTTWANVPGMTSLSGGQQVSFSSTVFGASYCAAIYFRACATNSCSTECGAAALSSVEPPDAPSLSGVSATVLSSGFTGNTFNASVQLALPAPPCGGTWEYAASMWAGVGVGGYTAIDMGQIASAAVADNQCNPNTITFGPVDYPFHLVAITDIDITTSDPGQTWSIFIVVDGNPSDPNSLSFGGATAGEILTALNGPIPPGSYITISVCDVSSDDGGVTLAGRAGDIIGVYKQDGDDCDNLCSNPSSPTVTGLGAGNVTINLSSALLTNTTPPTDVCIALWCRDACGNRSLTPSYLNVKLNGLC